jgi:beta-glucanase (GH16 family)
MRHLIIAFLLLPFTPHAQCWQLMWADEFDGTNVNTNNWDYNIGGNGWGNNEWQYYTDRVENASVGNGSLKIVARQENFAGSNYTSARMVTKGRYAFTYGKVSARIKLPLGQGIWPAFWTLPENNVYGGWPFSGEMDIMELIGHQPARVYGTLHASNNGSHIYSGDHYDLSSGTFNDDFHEFTMEWGADTIRHFVDGNLFLTQTSSSFNANPWPFNRSFHLLLNLAVGGNWPGYPNATTVFPQTMEVDWVRVYQRTDEAVLEGAAIAEPGASGQLYSLPNFPNANFNWSVPAGATIVSGQGTASITVNWGNIGGPVSATVTTNCGSTTVSLDVNVTPNIWENPAFEQNLVQWNLRKAGTANGTLSITTTDVQEGIKSAQVNVTAAGANPWDLQLQRLANSIVPGEQYTLSFWAKADANRLFSWGLIHPTNFTVYAGDSPTATTNWQQFSQTFTAPAGQSQLLFNLDLARFAGSTLYFDHFSLARTALLSAVDQSIQDETDKLYKIYPNPTTNTFTVESSEQWQKIVVKSVNGQVLRQFNPGDSLTLNGLSGGVFLLEIYPATSDIPQIEKIIIK